MIVEVCASGVLSASQFAGDALGMSWAGRAHERADRGAISTDIQQAGSLPGYCCPCTLRRWTKARALIHLAEEPTQ